MLDLTGHKYNKLTVINKSKDRTPSGIGLWNCLCDCGNEKIIKVTLGDLRTNHTKSCGCLKTDPELKPGTIFGRLTIVKKTNSDNGTRYLCHCSCGNKNYIARYLSLKSGDTKSCGCLGDETRKQHIERMTKHNLSSDPIYAIWSGIISRCYNKNNRAYDRYGGRGITVCDSWLESVENFNKDMGPRPSPKHSVDREDNNGNYEPSNCKWSTDEEQANNTRRNVNVIYKGKGYTLKGLAREYNLDYQRLWARLKLGWPIDEAVEKPLNFRYPSYVF